MIPWLLVTELLCLKGQTLGELVRDRMAAFPASGEINYKLSDARVEAISQQLLTRRAVPGDDIPDATTATSH
jgi:phosphomannomutase